MTLPALAATASSLADSATLQSVSKPRSSFKLRQRSRCSAEASMSTLSSSSVHSAAYAEES